MKKYIFVLTVITTIMLLVSCSSKPQPVNRGQLPEIRPRVGLFYAIGISSDAPNASIAFQNAQRTAQQNLASSVEVEVRRRLERLAREFESQGQYDYASRTRESYSKVVRQISRNMKIFGPYINDINDTYVIAVIDNFDQLFDEAIHKLDELS